MCTQCPLSIPPPCLPHQLLLLSIRQYVSQSVTLAKYPTLLCDKRRGMCLLHFCPLFYDSITHTHTHMQTGVCQCVCVYLCLNVSDSFMVICMHLCCVNADENAWGLGL